MLLSMENNKKVIVYIYVIGATHDPDQINCVVPYRIDEHEIFFGPCKIGLRKKLRREYLSDKCDYRKIDDEIYFIGVNASNQDRIRKILYIGRITEIMSFRQAHIRLKSEKYCNIKNCKQTPLHVSPIIENEMLIGYRHISNLHKEKNQWIRDLVSNSKRFTVINDSEILINSDVTWDAFPADCCLLMENIFWADKEGKQSGKKTNGIEIDDNIITILKKAQNKTEINNYAIFGFQKNGNAEGLVGRYLKIENEFASELIGALIKIKNENKILLSIK